MEAKNKHHVTNTTRKIGKNTYVVFAVHSPQATENIDTKVEKLIQRELSSHIFTAQQ